MRWPFKVLLGLWLGTSLVACSGAPADWRVSLEEGRALLEARQAVVFDIREPNEHARGVAPGTVLLPMSQLQQRLGDIPSNAHEPVLLICNTQNRSARAVQALRAAGYTNVRYVHGGMSGWVRQGWPLVAPAAR